MIDQKQWLGTSGERSSGRIAAMHLGLASVLVLSACSDRSDPLSVLASDVAPRPSLSAHACAESMAFLSSVPKGNTLTVVAPDYNVEEEWRFHGSPYSCATNRVSTMVSSSGPRLTAYHTYPFSSKEVYSLGGTGSPTPEGLIGSSFDCDGCFESKVHILTSAPDPAFVGNSYVFRAIYGPHDEYGDPAIVWSVTPDICTLDSGTSPATATFHGPGTCSFWADANSWGSETVHQTFEVMRPLVATAGEGTGVAVLPANPDDPDDQGSVALVFNEVTASGTVTVTTETVSSDADVEPPANFSLGEPPIYYNITVSDGLTFEGSVQVCITYTEGQFADEAGLTLLHWEDGAWVELPGLVVDTVNRTVCALTTSFSPFAIAYMTSIDTNEGNGKRKAKAKGKE